jgi:hypothetical protein
LQGLKKANPDGFRVAGNTNPKIGQIPKKIVGIRLIFLILSAKVVMPNWGVKLLNHSINLLPWGDFCNLRTCNQSTFCPTIKTFVFIDLADKTRLSAGSGLDAVNGSPSLHWFVTAGLPIDQFRSDLQTRFKIERE